MKILWIACALSETPVAGHPLIILFFPGMTDSEEEYEAFRKLISGTGLNMIQWRNFNIDPDWYLGKINCTETGEAMGVRNRDGTFERGISPVKIWLFQPANGTHPGEV